MPTAPHARRKDIVRFITIALVLISSAVTSAAWATPISDKYAQLGGAGGFLGQPTIAETSTPDGVGRYRHYEGGSIYWHPRTGAHEVHGLIGQRWAELNWEQGYLGYPITDEINTVDGGGRVSRFEGGELIWREKTNAVREVKSSDLVVELPFPPGETWKVTQAHGVEGLEPRQPLQSVCLLLGLRTRRRFERQALHRGGQRADRPRRRFLPLGRRPSAIQATWSFSAWDRAATPRTCTPRPAAIRRTSVPGRSSCRRRCHGATVRRPRPGRCWRRWEIPAPAWATTICISASRRRPIAPNSMLQAIRVGAGVVP